MSEKTHFLPDALQAHIWAKGVREPEALTALRAETATLREAHWQMPPEEAQFMALLGSIAGVKRYLELGTFTGYGTLWMALALGADAEIMTCERHEPFAAIARKHWAAAGVADRITLHMRPAIDVLDELLATRGENALDMVFIDADKRPYPDYYARAVPLVKPGGLVVLDNAFRRGGVADPEDTTKATAAIRQVTDTVHADERVDIAMVPIADGIIIARKR